ncbi:MAG: fused MFS/spermidine synthase, partial [Dietzia sp.]|nr:fused MFS/spermidine synthase [Dietzia sp.]
GLFEWRTRRWTSATAAALALVTVAGGVAGYFAPGGCDAETQYHCARLITDPDRGSGRTLELDGVRHSYVDIDDPTFLQFTYIRAIAAIVDASFPGAGPLTAYHLGGGGLTFPRYLAARRPGTDNVVSEIDGGLVRIDRDVLGASDVGVDLRVEDGRLGLRRLEADSRDLIVGDAFGGVSVPWHLTTVEAMADVRRVLKPDGVYVANLIDHGAQAFARAAIATLRQTFDHVLLTGPSNGLSLDPTSPPDGGNMVVVASDRPLDQRGIQTALNVRDTQWTLIGDTDLSAWIGEAQVLTDDYAPVDQLLQPYSAPRAR